MYKTWMTAVALATWIYNTARATAGVFSGKYAIAAYKWLTGLGVTLSGWYAAYKDAVDDRAVVALTTVGTYAWEPGMELAFRFLAYAKEHGVHATAWSLATTLVLGMVGWLIYRPNPALKHRHDVDTLKGLEEDRNTVIKRLGQIAEERAAGQRHVSEYEELTKEPLKQLAELRKQQDDVNDGLKKLAVEEPKLRRQLGNIDRAMAKLRKETA